jgi:Protein of unknown function (DUF2867)
MPTHVPTADRRLPDSNHLSQHWRIREIVPDFTLEDVWALPAQGSAEDFDTLLDVMAAVDPASASSATRALVWIRLRLGEWFGWDVAASRRIPGNTENTLSVRLPEDLRNTAADRAIFSASFTPLYQTDAEWAAEISNRTVHAVLHLAWPHQGDGRHQGQMAIYVKPRGVFGTAYMALIRPFRHWVVYPALLRQIDRAWTKRQAREG